MKYLKSQNNRDLAHRVDSVVYKDVVYEFSEQELLPHTRHEGSR